jgi:hypothetical protein
MRRTVKISSLGLLVFLGALAACSGDEAAPKAETAREAAPAAETADQAVMRVAEGLEDGRLEVVWQALPASYQRDVTDLIHDFGGAMDAELWTQAFGVIRKATQVLSEKREMILDHPMVQAQIEDREKANEAWESLIGILDVVVHSDLSDLERMKSLDVEEFLSDTGAEVVGRFKGMEAFAATEAVSGSLFGPAGAEVTLVSSDGDRARVRFQAPGEPSTEEEFVRVEGKWVPTQMADEWNDTLAAAREQLAGLSGEAMQANKQMTLMQLSMVDGVLDQLLATKTAEEFNAAIGGLLGMAMGAMMSQAQVAPSFEAPPQVAQPQPQAARQEPAPKHGSLESYIGQTVRVTERDGSSTDGFLIEVTDSMLVVEKRFGESSMAIEVSRAEIDTVEPIRQ